MSVRRTAARDGPGLAPNLRLRSDYPYTARGEVAMVAELWCDQKTKDKLGEAGLNEATPAGTTPISGWQGAPP